MNMSCPFDDSVSNVSSRGVSVNLPHHVASPRDLSVSRNAGAAVDISKVSREELEDRFLRLHEESLRLKQQFHKHDDKIKEMGMKLMRLVRDSRRMAQLAAGSVQPAPGTREVQMDELLEKVLGLEAEKERLKQHLVLVKQQLLNPQSRKRSLYDHVQSRVNSGMKKLRDDTSSQIQIISTRGLKQGGRHRIGRLCRYGISLLEEAKAKIHVLENMIETNHSYMEEMGETLELLQEERKKKEQEYQERLLQVRRQQTCELRSHIDNNLTMIKLQKQLADRSAAVTALEGRFLLLQNLQRTLKVSHDAAIKKVDELSDQLNNEKLKNMDQERQLQSLVTPRIKMDHLQEQISELEEEKELLKESNERLLSRAFDMSRQQKWLIHEQQLKSQIGQLKSAVEADLLDKHKILDMMETERGMLERVLKENKQLRIQCLEQRQQLDVQGERLKLYIRTIEHDGPELAEALLFMRTRKSQRSREMDFLTEVEDEASSNSHITIRELLAAQAEAVQELEKTRKILSMENRIGRDYKVELDCVLQRLDSDKVQYKQMLQSQAQLLDARTAKIKRLEAKLRDLAYNTKAKVLRVRPDTTNEEGTDKFDELLQLEYGENVLELQIISTNLSSAALEALGNCEPASFCTYSFYSFEPQSTPVATGATPKYGFTSRYKVNVDRQFLDYLHAHSVRVELCQSLGPDWRTVATGQIRLQQLLEQEGRVYGTIALVGVSDMVQSFGSLDYWMRLRIPMVETIRLYREWVKPVGGKNAEPALNPSHSKQPQNEVHITVHCCANLRSRTAQQPSPYVVYKFFHFPKYLTPTAHDCSDPQFNHLKCYSVPMDADLDRYLKSEVLQFYVFDHKEEQVDKYLGKARVPLQPLAQNQAITGVFELTDSSGLPAGQLQVTLLWKFTYLPPLTPVNPVKVVKEPKTTPLARVGFVSEACQIHLEKDEDDSSLSEGQLIPASPRSDSDESDSF